MTDLQHTPSRPDRAALVAQRVADTAIDEATIADLVHRFYAKVRNDAVLGPIFEARITDWDGHLANLCDFWSSIALMTGRYSGKPMQVHLGLPICGGHFARWLALWRQTAADVCTPAGSRFFVERAEQIAESLMLGIAYARTKEISTLSPSASEAAPSC